PQDRSAEGGRVSEWYEEPGLAIDDRFSRAADVRRHDGHAGGRGLHDRARETLAMRGKDEHVHRADEIWHIVAVAEHAQSVTEPPSVDVRGGQRVRLARLGPADRDERDVSALRAHGERGLEQLGIALLADETADHPDDDVAIGDGEGAAHIGAAVHVARMEAL